MRRARIIVALVVVAALLPVDAQAQAQSEIDRLREALRGLTIQLRTLEDQRVAIQAKLTESDRERQRANQLAESLKKQLKDAQDAQQQAIQEFNQRLTERDEALEKWKTAYNQAAEVAREKNSQATKFEAESVTYKARTKSCEAKNAELLKISNEILAGYRDRNLVITNDVQGPLIGPGLIAHQNRTQDFRDRILDQDVKIPAATGEDQKPQDQKSQDQKTQVQKTQDQQSEVQKSQDQKTRNKTAKSQQAGDRKAKSPAGNEGTKP